MKKVILFVLMLNFIGCSSDDDHEANIDYSYFLNSTQPQFKGKINDTQLFWDSKSNKYLVNSSYIFPNGDSEDPNRFLRFVLFEDNGNNEIVVTAPIYDTSSEIEFEEVFGIGVKKIGDLNSNFHIRILKNDTDYEICNSDANYNIEILKTEEIISMSTQPSILKVWFKIDNIKLNNCNPDTNDELNNGLVIAQFIGYRKY